MKQKKLLALFSTISLLLASCGSAATEAPITEGEPQVQESQVEEHNTELNQTETGHDDSSHDDSNQAESNHQVSVTIDGFSNDHIPKLDGSLANEPLLIRLMCELTGVDEDTAETYMAESFVNGGTSTSWARLIYDEIDMLISYEPPQEVKDTYRNSFSELEIDSLGRDGLVFIVNVDNPVDSLTIDQIRDIYTGRITDWAQVGGNPGPIQAFQRNATSGSQTLLNKLVMNGEKPMEPDTDLFVGSMGELIERVAGFDGDGGAIGFSVYYYADNMKADPNLKMIQVEGVAPSNETIGDGTYPLVNDFYMAIRADEPQDAPARALRDWLLSDDGRALLEEEGYVWARAGMPPVSEGTNNPVVRNW